MAAALVVLSAALAGFTPPLTPTRPAISGLSVSAPPPRLREGRREPPRSPWPLPPAVSTAAAVGGAALLLAPGAAHALALDSSFVQASSLIFVSEIGDKTFFIAALLAARASKLLTFAGCAGALAFMTVVSVLIGQVFHSVPPSLTRGLPIDDYVAIASFVYFGIKSIADALAIEEDGSGIDDEREEARSPHPHPRPGPSLHPHPRPGPRPDPSATPRQAEKTLSNSIAGEKGGWPLVVEACTLTVAAEVGDRSQLATIALAAAGNPFGVAAGGIVGHCAATGMAVLGGSFVSKYLSERVIGLIGGVLFLVFALTTAVGLF